MLSARRECCHNCKLDYPAYYMSTRAVVFWKFGQRRIRRERWCSDCSINENFLSDKPSTTPPPKEEYVPGVVAIRPPGRYGPSPLHTYLEAFRKVARFADIHAFAKNVQIAADIVGMTQAELNAIETVELQRAKVKKIERTTLWWRRNFLRQILDWTPAKRLVSAPKALPINRLRQSVPASASL